MAQYPTPRAVRTPPHLSLRHLRKLTGRTQADICEAVTEILSDPKKRDQKPFTPGSLSAIESGLRGPSARILDAIAVAYGLDPGDLVTDYEPRAWKDDVA